MGQKERSFQLNAVYMLGADPPHCVAQPKVEEAPSLLPPLWHQEWLRFATSAEKRCL